MDMILNKSIFEVNFKSKFIEESDFKIKSIEKYLEIGKSFSKYFLKTKFWDFNSSNKKQKFAVY